MPRGGKVNKKGRARHFTSPEEIERQNREDSKAWRAKKEEESEEEDEASKSENSDSESSSDGDKVSKKESGVEAELANPNRVVKKNKKVDELTTETPELSRREREEIEKQRAREHYQRLHAQGKTEEARADLARLAIIRQQREEAARKREEERKMKEDEKAAKTASIHKAMGRRT